MSKPLKNFLTPIIGFIFVVGGCYLLSAIH